MARHIVPITLEAMAGDAVTKHLLRAPTLGGGLTLTGAYIINGATTTSGTSMNMLLINYGTSGTVAGSTIGTAGGVASVFTDATPKAVTIVAAQAFVDAGEWIVARKGEVNSSDWTDAATIVLELVDGVVTQG